MYDQHLWKDLRLSAGQYRLIASASFWDESNFKRSTIKMILLALLQQLSLFPLCAPQSSQWTASYGPGFALLLVFSCRSQSLIVALGKVALGCDCVPESTAFRLLGEYFSQKHAFRAGQFSLVLFFFVKNFKRMWYALSLHFPPVCFPSVFELCLFESVCPPSASSFVLLTPPAAGSHALSFPLWDRQILWGEGGRKWTPISHHLCAVGFL